MSARIRQSGAIVCAAMHGEEPHDTYVPDDLHYRLSVDLGVLVSERMDKHKEDGLWWWFDEVPEDRTPDPIYAATRDIVFGTAPNAAVRRRYDQLEEVAKRIASYITEWDWNGTQHRRLNALNEELTEVLAAAEEAREASE